MGGDKCNEIVILENNNNKYNNNNNRSKRKYCTFLGLFP